MKLAPKSRRALARVPFALSRQYGLPMTLLATSMCLPQLVSAQTASPAGALDRIVVTATRTPQPLSSVLADVSVVDRAEIERSGVFSVADLLARLPGIEMARNGGPGTSTSVFIRGSETRHTAVYIDGVRVDSQSLGGATWESIPIDQIDRIEVLRGPAAAVYGSDAVGGVVQLFTKRGKGKAKPSVALTVGSYATAQGQVGLSGSSDIYDFSLSASRGESDGFDARTNAVNHNLDKDGWKRNSISGRMGLKLGATQRIDASMLSTDLRSGYDGSLTANDQNRHALRTGALSWESRWNKASTTRVQLGQTKSTYETQPSFYRTETLLTNYVAQHEQRFGNHALTGILERREDRLFNPATMFSAALRGRRHQSAVSVGWRGDFGAHGVQAHVRHDSDSEFGGKSTGSLAWGWQFAPGLRLTAATATSFRAPTLFQRFSQYGNPSLVPEAGKNVELGLRWAPSAQTEASLTTWRNQVRNLINFGPPGPCPSSFGCYVNVGRAQLNGATLAGRTQLGAFALRGSLDWHDPTNAVTNKVLPRRAKRLATLGAEANLGAWSLGSEVQAAGERFDNAANTQRLGGYGLLNVYARTKLFDGVSLEARIDNVGDKKYELARTYNTPGRNGQLTVRWTPR